MQGHEHIYTIRKQGQKPAMIFINDYPCKTDWHDFDAHVTVSTAGDPIETLDLRFLVGCSVNISGTDEKRCKALFEASKAHGAHLVVACQVQENNLPWNQSGYLEVWRKHNA